MKKRATVITMLAVQLGLVVFLPSSSSAEQWTWEELYKGGNYIDAALALKKAINSGQKTVVNYYYYADCLMRTDKTAEALDMYRQVYKMSPKSQYGKYALRAMQSQTAQAKAQVQKSDFKVEQIAPSQKGSNSQSQSSPPAEVTISDADIKRRLPPIHQSPPSGPSLQEVSLWPLGNQAGYYSEAAARVDAAQQRLDEAQQLLSRATAATGGLSDPFRHYGESEAETRARVEAGKARAESFLKAYNDNVAYYQKQLENEQAILRLCTNARNTWYVYPPGIPIYRPY